MQKEYIFIILCVFFTITSCSRPKEISDKNRLQVLTTLFPLYDFSKEVGKEKAHVTLLLPPGIEPHDYEPKPKDISLIKKADIFIYTGKYMERWVESILSSLNNKKLLIVDTSRSVQLSGQHDPHFWLDPELAKKAVVSIALNFIIADPKNKDFYLKNADEYNKKLESLDREIKNTLDHCRLHTIIYGGHFAFGYFIKRYNLKYISPYRGFSPNAEPISKNITELIKNMKENKIKTIYFEELVDPKIAKMISQETGAKMLLLNGAHNISKKELEEGINYLDIMNKNITNLKTGLEYSK